MSYNFLAEKSGENNMPLLRQRLSEFALMEFFPVDVDENSISLGVSIPFKAMDDKHFERQFEEAMSYLLSEQGFQVTDLYTGKAISHKEISMLARQIST